MSNEAERALRHAVRGAVVLRYLGELGLVLGVTALVPTLGAVVFNELPLALPYALVSGLLIGAGMLARRMPAPAEIQRNEALVITAAAFVLGAAIMAVPFALEGIPWLDALFEAVSGITTTGLSTLASVEDRSRTFLLARAWLQWVGGLGFVVLSLALTLEPAVVTPRLGASTLEPANVVGSIRIHARRVLFVYLGLTAFGVTALAALGTGGFDAVVHTLAGVSTGGFAPRDSSLATLTTRIQWGVLLVSMLGAVSLPLYAELRRGRWRDLRDDVEVRALVVLIAVQLGLLLVATRAGSGGAEVPAGQLALLAISAQSTTGFSTVSIDSLSSGAQALLVLAMITGGSMGSTAGGMKLLRVLLVVRLVQWLVAETRLPAHAVSGPTLSGVRLGSDELLRAAALVTLFVTVVFVSWLPFLVYGYAPLHALFEVASAAGTVGLSTGLSRPELEPGLKGLLCVNMLLGRLEIFALLVALSPRTWIGRRTS